MDFSGLIAPPTTGIGCHFRISAKYGTNEANHQKDGAGGH